MVSRLSKKTDRKQKR